MFVLFFFVLQAEDGIRDLVRSRGLGDVYKRQVLNGGLGEQNDQIENYMDYSLRACQNMFSLGQKDRMRQSFLLYRGSLLTSTGCQSAVSYTHLTLPTSDLV